MRSLVSKLSAPALLAASLVSRQAAAEVPLCVEVVAPAPDLESFRKLVRVELDRHPTHRVVESECRSRLRVELLEAAGTRFLTAQIDREVPMRFALKDPIELVSRAEEAIRLVLHNDPTYLNEDVTHLSAVQRLGQSVLVKGRFAFRLELFDTISRGGTNAVTVPGMALGVTRGSGHWWVMGRLYGGGSPTAVSGTERVLQVSAGVDGGLGYEFFEKGFWSPYVAVGGGVQFVRYVGREHSKDKVPAHLNDAGPTLSLRAGARVFRWYNFDLDLFVHGYLPLTLTRDVDGTLFSEKGLYTPSVQIGLGVGF